MMLADVPARLRCPLQLNLQTVVMGDDGAGEARL